MTSIHDTPRSEDISVPGSAANSSQFWIKRYKDAYRVAGTMNTFGSLGKIGGIVFGLCICGISVLMGFGLASAGDRAPLGQGEVLVGIGTLVGFLGVCIGIFFGAVFFVLGILISAVGQNLMATLDTAVHSSPFIPVDLKGQVMW